MIFTNLISILEVISLIIPALLVVAYVTVAERKTMASMQRRLGPNLVGYYGLLQAFADALKLLLKEYVSPTQSNFILFFLGPVITLVFSLLSFAVIPYMCGLTILDLDLGILYLLAVSSLSTYGILLAGWSANSKYAFLGSLRSTAQLISYELILSSAILIVILLTGSLNLTSNLEHQKAVWFIFPLFPVFIVFFISCVAETNRAPFDLAEAESELVSGFMTEHAAVIFVFFFLAEYASIVVICILTSILFLGGYLITIPYVTLYSFTRIFIDYLYHFLYITIDLVKDLYNYLADRISIPIWHVQSLYTTIEYYFIFPIKYIYFMVSNLFTKDIYATYDDLLKLLECSNNSSSIPTVHDKYKNLTNYDPLVRYFVISNENTPVNVFTIEPELANPILIYFNNLVDSNLVFSISKHNISNFNFTFFNYFSFSTISSLIIGIKSSLMIFLFIWARASLPRVRFDQLMSFCWTVLLPLVVAFIVLIPCLLYGFDILPNNIYIL